MKKKTLRKLNSRISINDKLKHIVAFFLSVQILTKSLGDEGHVAVVSHNWPLLVHFTINDTIMLANTASVLCWLDDCHCRRINNFKRLLVLKSSCAALKLEHSGRTRGKDSSGRGSGRTWVSDGLSLTGSNIACSTLPSQALLSWLLTAAPFSSLWRQYLCSQKGFFLAFGIHFLVTLVALHLTPVSESVMVSD